MGGAGDDHDARLADLQPPDPMVNRDHRVRPVAADLLLDLAERRQRQRLERFVFEVTHAPLLVGRAHDADK